MRRIQLIVYTLGYRFSGIYFALASLTVSMDLISSLLLS
jgi:hypothetical protein